MYHIASLILGILALGMALLGIKKGNFRFYSMTMCALSILCQLRELARLAKIEEASGIFDTAPTASKLATALLAITFLLNLLALHKRDRPN